MENCVFCKIISKEIPAAKIWEDDNYMAFLSIAPINPGHTLVIPKKHTEYIFDLSDDFLSGLVLKSKFISHAIKKAFEPKTGRIGIMVAGGEVNHVHMHLIPMDNESDLTFSRAKTDTAFSEIEKNAELIRTFLK